jgi:hypothetical protein
VSRIKIATVGALVFALGLLGGVTGAWLVVARQVEAQPSTVSANSFSVLGLNPEFRPGQSRAVLQENADGSTTLAFPDQQGQTRMTLGMANVGQPVIALHDAKGTARAVLALKEDGSPHLVFLDENGFLIWSAP